MDLFNKKINLSPLWSYCFMSDDYFVLLPRALILLRSIRC